MADNIYDVKVGDKLTPAQIRQAAGGGRGILSKESSPDGTNKEEVVIAEKKFENAQDESKKSPDAQTETQPEVIDEFVSYRYPLDMSPNYPGRITFTSYKVEGLDIGEKLGNFVGKAFERNKFRNRRQVKKEQEAKSVAEENLTDEQKQNIAEESKQLLETTSYENLGFGDKIGTVTLPLMPNLNFSDNAVYQSVDLGVVAGSVESLVGGSGVSLDDGKLGKAATALAAQKLSTLIGPAIGAAAGALGGTAGSLVGAVAGSGATDQISNALQNATRIAVAPNERQLFQRVNLRKFSFNFRMVAMSESEAKEIKQIVKFFRSEMYPEKITITESGLPLAYTYPNVFEIKIKNRSGNNPAFNIQRCYLESVNTTFNTTGNGMYQGDYFIEVNVQLNFTEVAALDKLKISKENY